MKRSHLSVVTAVVLIVGLRFGIGGQAHAAGEFVTANNYTFSKSGITLANSTSASITIAGTNVSQEVVTVSTNDTAWSISPCTAPAYVIIKNMASVASANWIKWGNDGTNYPSMLLPGQQSIALFTGSTVHFICKTNTTPALATAIDQ